MSAAKAVLLAVVEGVTEFLPISSTGHMILVDAAVELSADPGFNKAFMVIIQLPAILSVVAYFWSDLWPFAPDRIEREARLELWTKILVAVIPALILGALFDTFLERHLFKPLPVAAALLIGGVALILVERLRLPKRYDTVAGITYGAAIAIGVFQCFAMVPGTSRSAATIIGAMALGASRPVAAKFSFFLAIPTMAAATGWELLKGGLGFSGQQWLLLGIGSVVSFFVAYASIAGLMHYIQRHSFDLFGYYRIVLALVVVWASLAGRL